METRHRLGLPLRRPVIFASEKFVGEGTILDLSVPGCAVHSDVVPLSGDYVRLHVVMPDEEGPIEVARAKVVWAKQQRFGGRVSKVLQRAAGQSRTFISCPDA